MICEFRDSFGSACSASGLFLFNNPIFNEEAFAAFPFSLRMICNTGVVHAENSIRILHQGAEAELVTFPSKETKALFVFVGVDYLAAEHPVPSFH